MSKTQKLGLGICILVAVFFISYFVELAKLKETPTNYSSKSKSSSTSKVQIDNTASKSNTTSVSTPKATATPTPTATPKTAVAPTQNSSSNSYIEIDKTGKTLKLYTDGKVNVEYKIVVKSPATARDGKYQIVEKSQNSPTGAKVNNWLGLGRLDSKNNVTKTYLGIHDSPENKEVYLGCIIMNSKDASDLYSKVSTSFLVIIK